MYLCEQCGKEVYEKFGSGRFCSRSCSNKYVALHQSDEAKAKKVEVGKRNLVHEGRVFTKEERLVGSINGLAKIRSNNLKRGEELIDKILANEVDPYSGGYRKFKELLIKFGYKEWKCDCCNSTEWIGKKIPLELHHINGDKRNNSLENIQLLCPNCHALTDNYKWRGARKKKDIR